MKIPDDNMNLNINTHKIQWLAVLLLLCGMISPSIAQGQGQNTQLQHSASFIKNESLSYSVYFKWGLIRGKAGDAHISTKEFADKQWFQRLIFRTTGIFDSVFSMRDTMETLYNQKYQPLRWEKRVREDGDRIIDILTYNYSADYVSMKSKRTYNGEQRVDTVLVVNSPIIALDMLSSFSLMRTLPAPVQQTNINFLIPIGKDLVPAQIIYAGEDQVKLPNGTVVDTYYMKLNIRDAAFKSDKSSAEVWITKDKYQIPVKVQTKLKIGYSQCIIHELPQN